MLVKIMVVLVFPTFYRLKKRFTYLGAEEEFKDGAKNYLFLITESWPTESPPKILPGDRHVMRTCSSCLHETFVKLNNFSCPWIAPSFLAPRFWAK
jgi:hypothetical protein